MGASVRQRLLNQAKAQSRPFQEVTQYYAMERFLYRLARSPHANEFILKGALLLSAWRSPLSRSTMDIDLLGKTSNKLDDIRSILSKICVADVEPDGISFDPASLETAQFGNLLQCKRQY
ncbi:MAG TPA: nucleotidyl transferase AbiEii/AbiGii toxin family protein [Terriglobales bacterium]|nr:nucleotidyl transferase AbiEii/AbiGii toxin family protein [Terriglobales bacterium]